MEDSARLGSKLGRKCLMKDGYRPLKPDSTVSELKEGDQCYRWLAGIVRMVMVVVEVKEDILICGNVTHPNNPGLRWTFSRKNGAEIDEDIGWDETQSGSLLTTEDKAP